MLLILMMQTNESEKFCQANSRMSACACLNPSCANLARRSSYPRHGERLRHNAGLSMLVWWPMVCHT